MKDIISIAMGELTTAFDNEVVKAVQKVGIDVDKEELLKALDLYHSLVRCRECKHNYNTAINHGKMQPRCDFTDYKLTENDYCSRGEREGE